MLKATFHGSRGASHHHAEIQAHSTTVGSVSNRDTNTSTSTRATTVSPQQTPHASVTANLPSPRCAARRTAESHKSLHYCQTGNVTQNRPTGIP